MLGLTGIRLYASFGAALIVAAFVGWAFRVDHLRGKHLDTIHAMQKTDDDLLGVIRTASDNPKLAWRDAGDQVQLLAASRNGWKSTANLQSARIDALAQETARLKALSEDLRRKAQAAIAKRDEARRQLETMALDPGDRADCEAQLRDAVEALDRVWAAGS